jgi:hypothetical protein
VSEEKKGEVDVLLYFVRSISEATKIGDCWFGHELLGYTPRRQG